MTDHSGIYKDTGWAWMILLASTLQMALTVGIIKSSGVLFVAFQERFQSTSAMTSLLSTVHNAVYSVSALLVMTVFVKLTSSRVLLFIGSMGACIAFVVTALAEDIKVLLLSYGVLQGLSFACLMPTALTMVSHYFEKRRGFANCITITGSSIGSLIYAPLITKLLNDYGYQGCMVLLAAIMLHGCVCGALFRPLSFYGNIGPVKEVVDIEENRLQNYASESELSSDSDSETSSEEDPRRFRSLVAKQGSLVRLENQNNARMMFLRANKSFERTRYYSENRNNDTNNVESDSDLEEPHLKKKSVSQLILSSYNNSFAKSGLEALGNAFTRSMEKGFSGSNYVIESMCTIPESILKEENGTIGQKSESHDLISEGAPENEKPRSRHMLLQILAYICDTDIIRMPIFIAFQISGALLSAGTMLCTIFIVPHAKEMDIPEDRVAMLVTIFSAVDICGRILVALISDKEWLRRSNMAAGASLVVSISAHLLRFYSTYTALVIYSVILGALNGVFFSLVAVIIVDYMTLERLQSVLGFTHLCQGFSVACVFYLIGYIRDRTGSYVVPFHVLGTMSFLGALLMFFLPFIEKSQQPAAETSSVSEEEEDENHLELEIVDIKEHDG